VAMRSSMALVACSAMAAVALQVDSGRTTALQVNTAAVTLPSLGGNRSRVTISGHSSGADMAVMYMVAHSSSLAGLAVYAGNMPRCYVTRFERDSLLDCQHPTASQYSTAGCTNLDPHQAPCDPEVRACPEGRGLIPLKCQGNCGEGQETNPTAQAAMVPNQNVSETVTAIEGRARREFIDATTNLRGKRVYLFRGRGDNCYVPGAVDHTEQFFSALGAATHFRNSQDPIAHDLPMLSNPEAEGYDGMGAALGHFYGELSAPNDAPSLERLLIYDQTEFDPEGAAGFSRVGGRVYVPAACEEADAHCPVHVFLHGCNSGGQSMASRYSYLEQHYGWGWIPHAETNDIIVLFPHIEYAEPIGTPQNQHCWDQFGQMGDHYSDRNGPQIRVIHQMVQRLLANP